LNHSKVVYEYPIQELLDKLIEETSTFYEQQQ
jgi:hypothetical protein